MTEQAPTAPVVNPSVQQVVEALQPAPLGPIREGGQKENPSTPEITRPSGKLLWHIAQGNFENGSFDPTKTTDTVSEKSYQALEAQHDEARDTDSQLRKARVKERLKAKIAGITDAEITSQLIHHGEMDMWSENMEKRAVRMLANRDNDTFSALKKLGFDLPDNSTDPSLSQHVKDALYKATSDKTGEYGAFYKKYCARGVDTNTLLARDLSLEEMDTIQPFLEDILGGATAFKALKALKQTAGALPIMDTQKQTEVYKAETALHPDEEKVFEHFQKGAQLAKDKPAPLPTPEKVQTRTLTEAEKQAREQIEENVQKDLNEVRQTLKYDGIPQARLQNETQALGQDQYIVDSVLRTYPNLLQGVNDEEFATDSRLRNYRVMSGQEEADPTNPEKSQQRRRVLQKDVEAKLLSLVKHATEERLIDDYEQGKLPQKSLGEAVTSALADFKQKVGKGVTEQQTIADLQKLQIRIGTMDIRGDIAQDMLLEMMSELRVQEIQEGKQEAVYSIATFQQPENPDPRLNKRSLAHIEQKETPELIIRAAIAQESTKNTPETNEDSSFIDLDNLTGGVFDGAGGEGSPGAPKRASQDASKAFAEVIKNAHTVTSQQQAEDLVKRALEAANTAVIRIKDEGMTTATVFKIWESNDGQKQVTIGNVGDSRASIIKPDGTIIPLTRDHNLMLLRFEKGLISEDDYKKAEEVFNSFDQMDAEDPSLEQTIRLKNAQGVWEEKTLRRLYDNIHISRGLGSDNHTADIETFPLEEGDTIFLHSDGVQDNLSNPLQELIIRDRTNKSPEQIVTRIVDDAIQNSQVNYRSILRAKKDDITALAVKLESRAPAQQEEGTQITQELDPKNSDRENVDTKILKSVLTEMGTPKAELKSNQQVPPLPDGRSTNEVATFQPITIEGNPVTFGLTLGTLTAAPVEAIIVPTTSNFSSNDGNVAYAVERDAGTEVYQHAQQALTLPALLGTSIVVDSGNLKDRGIHNIIFLNTEQGRDLNRDELAYSVAQALLAADEKGITSVALPLVGQGHTHNQDAYEITANIMTGLALYKQLREQSGQAGTIKNVSLVMRWGHPTEENAQEAADVLSEAKRRLESSISVVTDISTGSREQAPSPTPESSPSGETPLSEQLAVTHEVAEKVLDQYLQAGPKYEGGGLENWVDFVTLGDTEYAIKTPMSNDQVRQQMWKNYIQKMMSTMTTHGYTDFAPVTILERENNGEKQIFYIQRSLRLPEEARVFGSAAYNEYNKVPLDYAKLQEDLKSKGLEIGDPKGNWVQYKNPVTGKIQWVLIDFSRVRETSPIDPSLEISHPTEQDEYSQHLKELSREFATTARVSDLYATNEQVGKNGYTQVWQRVQYGEQRKLAIDESFRGYLMVDMEDMPAALEVLKNIAERRAADGKTTDFKWLLRNREIHLQDGTYSPDDLAFIRNGENTGIYDYTGIHSRGTRIVLFADNKENIEDILMDLADSPEWKQFEAHRRSHGNGGNEVPWYPDTDRLVYPTKWFTLNYRDTPGYGPTDEPKDTHLAKDNQFSKQEKYKPSPLERTSYPPRQVEQYRNELPQLATQAARLGINFQGKNILDIVDDRNKDNVENGKIIFNIFEQTALAMGVPQDTARKLDGFTLMGLTNPYAGQSERIALIHNLLKNLVDIQANTALRKNLQNAVKQLSSIGINIIYRLDTPSKQAIIDAKFVGAGSPVQSVDINLAAPITELIQAVNSLQFSKREARIMKALGVQLPPSRVQATS